MARPIGWRWPAICERQPGMTAPSDHRLCPPHPAVDRASPGRWRARVDLFITSGRERLAALGVVLVLGFMLGVLALVLFPGLSQTVVAGDTMTLDTRVLLWLRQFQGPVVDIVARVLSAMGSEVLAVLGSCCWSSSSGGVAGGRPWRSW